MLKYKLKAIIIITLTIFLLSIDLISAQQLPLLGVIIIVDPGHQSTNKPYANRSSYSK